MKYVEYNEESQKFRIHSLSRPSMTEDDAVFSLYQGLSMQIDDQIQALKKQQDRLNTTYEQWLKEKDGEEW